MSFDLHLSFVAYNECFTCACLRQTIIKSNQIRSNPNESSHKAVLQRLFRAETLNLTVVALHQQPALLFQEYLIHSLHIHHFIFSLSAHRHATRASFYSHRRSQTNPFARRWVHNGRIWRRRRCCEAGEGGAAEGGWGVVLPPPPSDLPAAGGRQRRPLHLQAGQ